MLNNTQSFSVFKKDKSKTNKGVPLLNTDLHETPSKLSFQTKVTKTPVQRESPSEKNLNKSPFSFKLLPKEKAAAGRKQAKQLNRDSSHSKHSQSQIGILNP